MIAATPLTQTQVRYIKLGTKGSWEQKCLERNVVRIGFGSGQAERFAICQEGRWDALRESFLAAGRTKGVATDFANQMRHFFEDDGSTVWITFVGERLYWALLDASPPEQDPSLDGVFRPVRGQWRCTDLNGEELIKDRLSGAADQADQLSRDVVRRGCRELRHPPYQRAEDSGG